jgi:hypothetical protein
MIRYFVGVPGAGKTTMSIKLMKRELKPKFFKKLHKLRYDYLFSNFENDISNYVDLRQLATKKLPKYSYLALDESGLEFNSRDFKTLQKGFIEFFKLHRHEHYDIDLFSQTWDDTDKQIRDLASEIWLLRKIGPLSIARCVYKRVGIDDVTKQLQYQHFWRSILWQLLPFMPKQFIFCFRPFHYKHFNSFSEMDREVISPPEGETFKTTISAFSTKLKR